MSSNAKKVSLYILIFMFAFIPNAIAAGAQPIASNGFMDILYNDIVGNTSAYQSVFAPAARSLLISLSLGEFVWDTSIRVLKGADSAKIVAFVMVRIVSIGFVYYFIANPDWVAKIIAQGQEWASQAGGMSASTTPSEIAGTGVKAVGAMMEAVKQDNSDMWSGFRNLIEGIIVAGSGVAIMVLFLLIGLQYLITLIESTIVVSIGFVMLGFLGSAWTKQFGKNYISYIIAVSIKLMVTLMICSVVLKESQNWTSLINDAHQDLGLLLNVGFQIIIDSIVLLVVVRNIPAYAAGIISGVSTADASSVISSAAAVMMGAAAMLAGATGLGKLAMGQTSRDGTPTPPGTDNGSSDSGSDPSRGSGGSISPSGSLGTPAPESNSATPKQESSQQSAAMPPSPTPSQSAGNSSDAPNPAQGTSQTTSSSMSNDSSSSPPTSSDNSGANNSGSDSNQSSQTAGSSGGSISGGDSTSHSGNSNQDSQNNQRKDSDQIKRAVSSTHRHFQQVGGNTQVQAPSLGDKDHGV